MPFLANLKKNEEENISGEAGIINPGQQNIAAPKAVKNSGSWTNLNAYLDANKGNAEQMGDNIAGKINEHGNTTRTNINNASQDFNTKADAGTISNLADATKDAENIANAARYNTDNNQINNEQINRFKEVSNASYKGPADLTASDYHSNAQKNVNKSSEYIQNAQSDEGRFNLLQENYERPTYTQGQKVFDNLLIQGNQAAKNNIQNSALGLNDIADLWTNTNTNATNLANQRITDSNAANAAARNFLTDNRNARTNEVNADLSNIENNWSNEYNDYNSLLKAYQGGDFEVTQAQADKLGLNGAGQGIYNILKEAAPESYLDLKAYDANKIVSKDQFAQLAALDLLANQFGGNSISRFTNKDDAGTLGLHNNFDGSKFGQAANNAETGFQNFADNKDFAVQGYGSDYYYDGLLNDNKNTENAISNISANLGDYLDNGSRTVNGTKYQNTETNLNPLSGNSFTSQFRDGILSIPDSILGTDFISNSSGQARAQNNARNRANAEASTNFMAALNDILNGAGYSNRVKIK